MARSNQSTVAEMYAEWHSGYMHVNDQRLSTGRRLYVSSVLGGTAGGDGDSPENSLSTLQGAIDLCLAGDYDQIVVMPGHNEDLAAAGAIDTTGFDGIRIVGVGLGAARPTFTFSEVAATVLVASGNVTIENCIFVTAIADVVTMISVQGVDLHLKNCEFRPNVALTMETLTYITVGGGGANAADGFHLEDCRLFSPAAGATQAISISEVNDRVVIEESFMCHDGTAATVWSDQILTNILVKNNIIHSLQAGVHAIEFAAAATGQIVGNDLYGDTLGTILDPGSCFCNDNLEVDNIDVAAVPTPHITAGPFLSGAFDVGSIAADTLTAGHIAAGALTATEIADAALDAGTYANDVAIWRVAVGNWNFTDDATADPVTFTVFTVTGDVVVRCVGVCDVALAAGGVETIELGVAGATAAVIAQMADGNNLDAHEIWAAAAPSATAAQVLTTWSTTNNVVIPTGQDIIFTTGGGNNMTGGDLDFYCLWYPLSADGNVVAA